MMLPTRLILNSITEKTHTNAQEYDISKQNNPYLRSKPKSIRRKVGHRTRTQTINQKIMLWPGTRNP